jgi:transcriptional regulator with XRE-family HTH domain
MGERQACAMDMRRLVGRNVRKFRLERGLTQEEFSVRSGFGQNYLSDLERGKRNPTVVTLWELSQVLEVTPVDLITPDDEAIGPRG